MRLFRESTGLAQDSAADLFGYIRGVMVALDHRGETRLQPRRAIAHCGFLREPVVVDRLTERLPRDASVLLAQDVVLVFAVP